MTLQWTPRAVQHLRSLWDYISHENPSAADQTLQRVIRATERLAQFPESGREGRVDGTRELVVPGTPFVVAYRVRRGRVAILAVFHAARRWPAKL